MPTCTSDPVGFNRAQPNGFEQGGTQLGQLATEQGLGSKAGSRAWAGCGHLALRPG